MNATMGKLLAVNLCVMLAGAAFLAHLRSSQRLGKPGVRAVASPDPLRMQIQLPTQVEGFRAEMLQPTSDELGVLPKDTSIARTRYFSNQTYMDLSVVMMGTDRTSIHQPQFCLTGQGFTIDRTEEVTLPIPNRSGKAMSVMKLTTTKQVRDAAGTSITVRGIFLYWFVAEGLQTARHGDRMWMMARELLTSGVLQRWSYVTCFSPCYPGQEDATFDRMSGFLTKAVPQFQLSSDG